jgi:hypothetical protein
MVVIDMDHDDSAGLLETIVAANSLTASATPALGLTRDREDGR